MSERGYPSPIHDESGKIKDVTVAHEMARVEEGARNKATQEKRRLFGLVGPSKETLKKEGARAAEPVEERYLEAKQAKDVIVARLRKVAESKGMVVFETEDAKDRKGISYGIHVEKKAKGSLRPHPILSMHINVNPPGPMEISAYKGAYPERPEFTWDDPVAAMNQAVKILEQES